MAGERGNDITVLGVGMTGNEQYRISSYNRTKNSFTVLIYSSGANGKGWADVSIPSTIQNGKYYNNDQSNLDFRGEGIKDGQKYNVRVTSKDISIKDGSDQNVKESKYSNQVVRDGKLKVRIAAMNKFTTIEFVAKN